MENTSTDNPEFYITEDGKQKKLEIPTEGMLGLLAYGDIGLRAWRKARQTRLNNESTTGSSEQIRKEENENNE